MNKYFSVEDKIYDIVKNNPKALDFFIANGFSQFSDEAIFEKMSKNVSLKMALMLKKINTEIFEQRLVNYLESQKSVDINLNERKDIVKSDVNVEGVLPCPIRIPLLEKFEMWLNENKEKLGYSISYELKSANMGLDWIKDQVKTGKIENVADIIMSAGYDLFFEKSLMGQFLENDEFYVPEVEMNKDFCNSYIDLRDPKNRYLITGVVPAVFLVNLDELNGRNIPKKWSDILSEDFEDSVAVPMGDLDLFNALVISIYKDYGMEGISSLARSYMKSLHPAQMVKSKSKKNLRNPVVSIIPYFFTQMVAENGNQIVVWPEDGAIISPIFMIAKKEKEEKVRPIIDFFTSKEIGEVFSANGKFPSTSRYVDNGLSLDKKFRWIGWDYIYGNDIGMILKNIENKFNEEILK